MPKAPPRPLHWLRSSSGGFDTTSLTPTERSRYHEYYEAARKRLDGAMQLGTASKYVPALLLFREGFTMLANAHLAARRGQGSDDPTAMLASFADWVAAEPTAGAPLLRDELLAASDPSTAVDSLDRREQRARVVELSSLAEDLLRTMSPQTTRRRDAWRMASGAVVVLAAAVSLALIAANLTAPEDIALHKRTTSSSAAFGSTPSDVVDGHAYKGLFGFHSANEPSAWLRIDLGREYDVTRVRIFGRHDCCFDQSVPVGFEVSDDDEHFRMVAEKGDAFDPVDPWEVNLDHVRARYVRLRRLEQGVLVLSEVRVFGESAPP